MAKKPLALALVISFLWNVSPAQATVFTGTCVVAVDFEFATPLRSITNGSASRATTSYDFGIRGAVDLNPLAGGDQACVVDNTPTSPFKSTFGSGSGNAIAWTCEAAVASGSWQQDWNPDPGAVFGHHTIAGTWGHWLMALNNDSLSFTGTIDLTVAPTDETKLADCATRGISNLSMIGVMHFQDPPPPKG